MSGNTEQSAENFVDGRACPPAGGLYARHFEAGRVADSCAIDVHAAADAAARALPFWSGLTETRRAGILVQSARRLIMASSEPQSTATALSSLRFPSHAHLLTRNEQGGLLSLADAVPCVCRLLFPLGANQAVVVQRLMPLLVTGHALVIGVLHNPKAPVGALTLPTLTSLGRCLPDGVINVISGRAQSMGRALLECPYAQTRVILRLNTQTAARCGAVRPDLERH